MTPTMEQTVIAVGHKTAQGGSAVAVGSGVAGWLSENHQLLTSVGAIIGIAIAVVGFAIQLHYQIKRDRRERGVAECLADHPECPKRK